MDIAAPLHLTLVGLYETSGSANDVNSVGAAAYVADGWGGGLQILDVSDPAHSSFLGSYPKPKNATAVEVVDGKAYISDVSSLHILLDVSDPDNPVEIGHIDAPAGSSAKAVSGDAWEGAPGVQAASTQMRTSKVQFFDVSNRAAPMLIAGRRLDDRQVYDPEVCGNYIFAGGSVYFVGRGQLAALPCYMISTVLGVDMGAAILNVFRILYWDS